MVQKTKQFQIDKVKVHRAIKIDQELHLSKRNQN